MSATETLAFGPFTLTGAPPALRFGEQAVALEASTLALLAAIARAPAGASLAALWPLVSSDEEIDEDRLCEAVGDINNALSPYAGAWYVAWYPDEAEPRFALVDASRVRPGLAALPARRHDIVGRDDAIARVVAQLRAHRFVTILAAGGMGKSTVAMAAAHAAAADFPDGIHVVELAPVVDSNVVAQRVAAALGCSSAEADALAVLQQWSRGRRALVVLDSCEHLIEGAALVAEALGGAGSAMAVLATSREPLRARGEWLYRLAPMQLPPPGEALSVAQAMEFSALRLFVDRARVVDPGFTLGDADVPLLVSLCTRLDGIALGIEIVAARADTLGLAALSSQLESLVLSLPDQRRGAPARHNTLAALLDWSFRLLTPVEQQVLRRLSVFRNGFTLALAAEVVADAAISADDVQEALLDLVAKSLVAPVRGGDTDRRRLLDTTRAYAGAKLDEAGERDAVSLRHAHWLSGALAEAEIAWNRMTRLQWLARYAPLLDDLRAALDWAFMPGGDVLLGAQLTVAGFPVGRQMLLVDEFTKRVMRAIESLANHPGPPAAIEAPRKRLNFLIACMGTGSGAQMEALAPMLEGEIGGHLGAEERLQLFQGFNGMWGMAVFRGDFRDGAVWAGKMEQLAATCNDPVARLVAGRVQAQNLHFAGCHAQSAAKARRVLEDAWRTIPLRYNPSPIELRVSMRLLLARNLWMQGAPDRAAAMAREAMELSLSDSPMAQCQAIAMGALPIALWSGLDDTARALASQLIALEKQLGFSHWQRWSRALCAMVALRSGAEVPATADASHFEEPEPVLADHLATLDDRWLTPRCIRRADEGLAGWCVPEALRRQGVWALGEASDDGRARGQALLQRSLAVAREQGALAWELRAATSLARHWRAHDRARDARALLEPVFARFDEGFDTADLRAAHALLSTL